MAVADVIFQLGVSGTEKVNADLAAQANHWKNVAGAVVEVGRAIADSIKKAEEYGDAYKALRTDMSAFNMATKGAINNMQAYRSVNAMQIAGVKATAKEMEALGKAAIKMSQETGVDATTAFDQLTDAVIKGTSRGLKPFGVQIEQTEDLVTNQKNALKALTTQFEDYNVILDDASEKMEAFWNQATRVKDLMVAGAWTSFSSAWMGAAGGIDSATSALNRFGNEVEESNGKITEWMFSAQGMRNMFAGMINEIGAFFGMDVDTGFAEAAYVKTQGLRAKGRIEDMEAESKRIWADVAKSDARFGTDWNTLSEAQKIARIEQMQAGKKAGKKKGKGGGGAKKYYDDYEFTDEDVAFYSEQAAALAGRTGGAATQGSGARYASLANDYQVAQTEARNARIDDLDAMAFDQWMAREEAKMMTQEAIEADKTLMEQRAIEERDRMWKTSQDYRVGVMTQSANATAGIIGNLSKTMNRDSEKGFKAAQGLAIAQTSVETPAAAMAAYKSAAAIPYVGFILGPLAAAAAIAAGVAQIAQIRKQKFSPTGGASGSVSTMSTRTPSIPTSNYGAGAQPGGAGSTIVNNVILDGTVIHSSMIKANDGAAQRGERSFTTAA